MSKVYSILNNLRPAEVCKKVQKICLSSFMILKNEITYYPKIVQKFEVMFAKYHNSKYSITFCNGTSAIEASLFAIGLESEDEVIVPSCTFHASIDPIKNIGAKPIFVDTMKNSLNISIKELESKITDKTKAIIVVHTFGYVDQIEQIVQIAQKNGIKVIEDCSHAHGAVLRGKKAGTFGDIGCFSLQGAKAVAAGEGGVAITNNFDLYIKMSVYGHFEKDKKLYNEKYKIYSETGYGHKARAHPIGIALAYIDFKYLDKENKTILKNIDYIKDIFKDSKDIKFIEPLDGSINGGFFGGLPILVNDSKADKIVQVFRKHGVLINLYPFAFHHKLEVYKQDSSNILPNTENLKNSLLLIDRRVLKFLPLFMKTKLKQINKEIEEHI